MKTIQTAKTYKIRFPESLAHTVELLVGRADDSKVVGQSDVSDQITNAKERLKRLRVETGHNRLHKVRAKSWRNFEKFIQKTKL